MKTRVAFMVLVCFASDFDPGVAQSRLNPAGRSLGPPREFLAQVQQKPLVTTKHSRCDRDQGRPDPWSRRTG